MTEQTIIDILNDELESIIEDGNIPEEELNDILEHYGTPRHSGRYPWGSGENPYQSLQSFQSTYRSLKAKGMTEKQIAKHLGMKSTAQLRARVSVAKAEVRKQQEDMARKLKDKGMSTTAIAERMFGSKSKESTVRSLLDASLAQRNSVLQATQNALKEQLEKRPYLDVGKGTELYLGISDTKLKTALAALQDEGYKLHYIPVEQLGTGNGQKTTVKVLTKGDVGYSEVYKNMEKIRPVNLYSEDRGETYRQIEPPKSVSSSRIDIRYAEQGGLEKDGVIELRRGCEDLNLGKANYAQVRIAVDGTHYLKGMAVYSDDLPKGIDIRFNTNKHEGTPMISPDKDHSVLKPMKKDMDNPFGATIKDDDKLVLAQRHYIDKDGKEQLSALNIVNEEGNWNTWSKTLSAQMLSKQPVALAKQQLDLTYDIRRDSFNEIMGLTNPTVKKKMLEDFAENCDSAAVHLKAHGMPGQTSKVILPVDSMPENQIYAPTYKDGTEVVLIRYPHAGIFEIPSLTVNNKNPEARRRLGDAIDAVGINAKTAQHLSGADFDGDTVLVIPNDSGAIKHSKVLDGLKDFEPKEAYRGYEGMVRITPREKQMQMGIVSNLITDMTLQQAPTTDIVKAVRHSMVIIDAEKHNLDWRRSERDNQIQQLKEKYQVKENGQSGGASTLISKAASEYRVGTRKERGIDPETGEKRYEYTNETYMKPKKNSKGEITGWTETERTIKSTKMAEEKDAFNLVSTANTPMERVYAQYANRMKALANEARKAAYETPRLKYDPEARKVYSSEVESLMSKLKQALMNKPLERQAQILANAEVKRRKAENPDMDGDDLKKMKGRVLAEKRIATGAQKNRVTFTDREWKAIQSGAVSDSFLKSLLDNADSDHVKQLSMPRETRTVSPGVIARIKSMASNGYTQAEIADYLGISTSTVSSNIK